MSEEKKIEPVVSDDDNEDKKADAELCNDNSRDSDSSSSSSQEASPMIAVEVNTNGDVSLEEVHDDDEEDDDDGDEFTEASNLLFDVKNRHIWIVTTAALPWRTGTAVNPLLRALTLCQTYRHVNLFIPWLENAEARRTLYGTVELESEHQQEEWIRNYSATRCGASPETLSRLNIRFYKGFYQDSFGSIFPLQDICSMVPKAQADICFLEEPEHLNWFRVPAYPKKKTKKKKQHGKESSKDDEPTTTPSTESSAISKADDYDDEDIDILGWAHKFRHVVGILHTNYADYIRQYAIAGTSLVTAPALNSLSSLVVKAYCHRVIRLSATLPHLDKTKEMTCNVHGVRHEFLEQAPDTAASDTNEDMNNSSSHSTASSQKKEYAAIYFVGKLIWAKGFGEVLEVQEKYKIATGKYFPIDIYGGGKDEKEIQKAFFGRRHTKNPSHASSTVSDDACEEQEASTAVSVQEADQKAAAVFGSSTSLRRQLCGGDDSAVDDENVITVKMEKLLTGSWDDDATPTASGSSPATTPVSLTTSVAQLLATPTVSVESEATSAAAAVAPLEILGDLSEKTLSTSIDTADAALTLIESVVAAGIGVSLDDVDDENDQADNNKKGKKKARESLPFHLAPAKSRFKWRRNPIPGRFLGVQDHIIVRDIPQHKIFLNMSTSEVLCTTSAEAMAMGKFVILPKHPSNEFFLQFPNCLAYETLDQCVVKLQYALENEPEPLTEKYIHMLSWEGATERLIKASGITKTEAAERKAKGLDKADSKAARFHAEAARKSHYVGNLFRGKIL